jgi:hypothetical protein
MRRQPQRAPRRRWLACLIVEAPLTGVFFSKPFYINFFSLYFLPKFLPKIQFRIIIFLSFFYFFSSKCFSIIFLRFILFLPKFFPKLFYISFLSNLLVLETFIFAFYGLKYFLQKVLLNSSKYLFTVCFKFSL